MIIDTNVPQGGIMVCQDGGYGQICLRAQEGITELQTVEGFDLPFV
jgi:hypothetical protein